MSAPAKLKFGRLKGRIKQWIKRSQSQNQNQSLSSFPLSTVQPASSGPLPNLGQGSSAHGVSNTQVPISGSQTASPQPQVTLPSGPSSNAGPSTSAGPVANIGSANVPSPAANQATAANGNKVPNCWVGLQRFANVLSSMSHTFGPLRAIVNELVECVNIYEMAAGDNDEYKVLQNELEQLFTELQGYFVDTDTTSSATEASADPTTESLCKCIKDELEGIKAKQGNTGLKQHLRGSVQDEVLACYRRVHGHLIRMSVYLSSSVKKDLDKQTKILQKQAENSQSDRVFARLSRLRPSLSACYNSAQAAELKRGECTAGTRMDALARMHSHASNSKSGAVFWLNGMAGTGKTTIAYTFCTEVSSRRHLAASFFCSRILPECRDVNVIIPSISYQLACYSQSFRAALFKVLEADPDIPTRSLHIQFEDLIAEPLLAIQRNNTLPPSLVVVIDALDECENKNSTRMMLDILLAKTSNLPIKFFVSSRPEPEIRDEMARQLGDDHSSRLVLHELERSLVQADIERYLRGALARLDLSDEVFAELARDSGVLFIYAATVVRYISYSNFNQNPRGRLQTVLSASGPGIKLKNKAIDNLYAIIIKEALEDEELDDTERNDILQVLHTIVCAQEPLAVGTLSGLLQFQSIDRTRAAIRSLWSVLHIAGTCEIVTTLHASFPDFILDETRSGRYYCNPEAHNYSITKLCFDSIEAAPPFNICELESSFVRDKKVTSLDARLVKAVPPELFYACRYWGAHVDLAGDPNELSEIVLNFLSTRLLLWIEVMNLKKSIQIAVDVITRVDNWSMRQTHSKELVQLTDDARCFTTAFASTPVSQSTPHLYLSMLPFWPQSRPVSQAYAKAFWGLPRAEGTAVNQRQLALLATWSFGGISGASSILFTSVRSATFSPDGKQVAFATHNRILVIDSLTGQQLARPMKGHSNDIFSVEFSPDGTRLISSSTWVQVNDAKTGSMILLMKMKSIAPTSVHTSPDGTRIVSAKYRSIYTWDAQTGDQILGPLEGHTGTINVVRYSPDGRFILSGGQDKTLHIWDARDGSIIEIIGPLFGVTQPIFSAGYSPNSSRVVFGSADGTIGAYCTMNKHIVFGPITGHIEAVTSVTYSPDGRHIASGSDDRTIRVWDAQTGDLILGPLEGHTGGVLSVAYSPDGSRIVSSSYDKTIRMWDARIKGLILNPLECHTGVVTTARYSPDGARICSGSEDKTIRVWDAESGALVLGPLKGHTGWVESTCYSPDGVYIASGSRDKTIFIWDARSGAVVLGPLQGHTKPITSVCYSPDGTHIASGAKDATIRVWDTRNGNLVLGPLEPEGNTRLNWIVSTRYSPSGTRIIGASGSNSKKDRVIQIWDAQSGHTVLVVRHGMSITALEHSPDDACFIFGSTDNTIRICDTQNGEIIRQIGARAPGASDLHSHTITSLGYSPAGDHIVSSNSNNIIRIWDARNGDLLLGPLAGHVDQINCVSYSPNGVSMTSGSSDATIRIWNVRLLSEPHPTHNSPHSNWELNPDGWIANSKNRSQILIWVPYDLRRSIIRSGINTLVISRNGFVRLDFDDAFMGEEWAKCYVSSA